MRSGPYFLLVWSAPRRGRILAFPVVRQTKPLQRTDRPVPAPTLDRAGLSRGSSWIILLGQPVQRHVVCGLARSGCLDPALLDDMQQQLDRVRASAHAERQAEPAWS